MASDLLAQAEHDPLASSILLTTSKDQSKEVLEEVYKKIDDHPRKEICMQSIKLGINCYLRKLSIMC